MGIITTMRRQDAIYWPPAGADAYGAPTHGALVELVLGASNWRVRWEDRAEEYQTPEGSTAQSNAVVYVPLLPDSSEVEPGGYLWLGVRADLTSEGVPADNPGAWEVRKVDRLPNLKATETLRTCYL